MSADDAGADGEVDAPLVFQCSKCRTIVGDSFSWVGSDKEMNTISLKGTPPSPVLWNGSGSRV